MTVPGGRATPARGGRKPSRRVVLGLIIAVAAAAGIGAAVSGNAAEGGRAAPAFDLPAAEDPSGRIGLADYAGRPLVLNFWATWCAPCRREMPALEAVADRYDGRVAFIGINHQDNRDDAAALIEELGITYPSGSDPEGTVARAYGAYGMPTTVLVRADGTIATSHTGELSEDALTALIDEHFDLDT